MSAFHITLPKFWTEFIVNEIPSAKLRFASDHWLFRFLPMTVWSTGYTVWFKDRKTFYDYSKNGWLNTVLAHEFVHLCEKRDKKEPWYTYWSPQSLLFLIFPTTWGLFGIWWALGVLFFFCLPHYSQFRAECELRAYKMGMLVDIVQLYLRFRDVTQVHRFCATLPHQYMQLIFSTNYWMQWTPWSQRHDYLVNLECFFTQVLYQLTQLASKEKIVYIGSVPEPYNKVFTYFTSR